MLIFYYRCLFCYSTNEVLESEPLLQVHIKRDMVYDIYIYTTAVCCLSLYIYLYIDRYLILHDIPEALC